MYSKSQKWRESSLIAPFKVVAVYLVWKAFHYWVSLGGTPVNHLWTKFIFGVGHFYALAAGFCLAGLGMKVTVQGITVSLISTHRDLWVQEHCLAIPAMVVFIGTIGVLNGNPKDKTWFIPLGIGLIALINVVRLVFVALAWNFLSLYYFNMHHSIIYAVITYGFIFLMIRWWLLRNE
jgi:exosortase/archaeosortase family protein